MPDVTDYQRIKARVLNLKPIVETDKDMQFSVNGIQIHLKHGEEVELLEPVYNALKTATVTSHVLRTEVDPTTGHARQIDIVTHEPKYEVIELGKFYWPDGHTQKRRRKPKSEMKEATSSMKDVAEEVKELVSVVRSSQSQSLGMDDNTNEVQI